MLKERFEKELEFAVKYYLKISDSVIAIGLEKSTYERFIDEVKDEVHYMELGTLKKVPVWRKFPVMELLKTRIDGISFLVVGDKTMERLWKRRV